VIVISVNPIRRRNAGKILACVAIAVHAVTLSAQITRDSAGVAVVTNARPILTGSRVLHLAPNPSLVIGDREGDPYLLSRVAGTARLGDGRIVIADGGSLQLRFFDSSGTFLKAVGRNGEGPGEFRELSMFSVLPGDTLVAGARMRIMSYFTGAGVFVRQTQPTTPGPAGLRYTAAVLGSGVRAVVAVRHGPMPAPGKRAIDSMPLTIVDRSNNIVRDVGLMAGSEFEMRADGPNQTWFGARASFADGGTTFAYGFPSEYSIRIYSQRGQLQRIIRRAWTPVHVTNADIETFVTEWGKRWIKTTGAAAEKERQELRTSAYAGTVPPFSQLIADRVGRLWVREAHLADAPGAGQLNTMPLMPSKWSVFDTQGRWLCDVTMPARFMPMDIGADYVLGTSRDGDGVETVVLYGLHMIGVER
jgi:hypothetical protein